jgi:hypothetical protein
LQGPATDAGARIAMTLGESTLVAGRDLLEVLEQADQSELARLLQRWVEYADGVAGEAGGYPLDLYPHNFVLGDDGELRVIDEEWDRSELSRQEFLGRGAFVTAWKLGARTPPERWPCSTVEELVVYLGSLMGLPDDGGWVADAIEREAAIEAEILIETGWDMRAPTQREAISLGLLETLGLRLADLPMGDRDHQRLAHERERFTAEHARFMELVDVFEQTRDARDRAVTNLERLRASRSWRFTAPVRRLSRLAERLRG